MHGSVRRSSTAHAWSTTQPGAPRRGRRRSGDRRRADRRFALVGAWMLALFGACAVNLLTLDRRMARSSDPERRGRLQPPVHRGAARRRRRRVGRRPEPGRCRGWWSRWGMTRGRAFGARSCSSAAAIAAVDDRPLAAVAGRPGQRADTPTQLIVAAALTVIAWSRDRRGAPRTPSATLPHRVGARPADRSPEPQGARTCRFARAAEEQATAASGLDLPDRRLDARRASSRSTTSTGTAAETPVLRRRRLRDAQVPAQLRALRRDSGASEFLVVAARRRPRRHRRARRRAPAAGASRRDRRGPASSRRRVGVAGRDAATGRATDR